MKKLSILLKVGLCFIIFLAVAFPVQAEAIKTEITGHSYYMSEIDPGVWTYPDGNVHVRGWTLRYFDHMSDPRLTGIETVVVNFNMQSAPPPIYFTGPMWGTSRIENEGGYWDISWTGERDEQGFAFLGGVGHGHGGYEGLITRFEATRLSPDFINDPFIFTGTIIDPQGE